MAREPVTPLGKALVNWTGGGGKLGQALRNASVDELDVIGVIWEGIVQHRGEYGPLNLDKDRRDFAVEIAYEMRDIGFYKAVGLLLARRFDAGVSSPSDSELSGV